MAYHVERSTGDLVIDGFELGIAQSPHKGIAHMQNVNISSEEKEVMVSYGRTKETLGTVVGDTLTAFSTDTLLTNLSTSVKVGSWINISASTITGLAAGNYYVVNNPTGNRFQIADPVSSTGYSSTVKTGMGLTGTATFNTNNFNLDQVVASATENYTDSSGNAQYRYYVLDINGLVWVHDTATLGGGLTTPLWFLPNIQKVGSYASGRTTASGLAVLNGWIFVFAGNYIGCKSTSRLGDNFITFSGGTSMGLTDNKVPHFAFVGHQGKMYYTDGVYLGSIFPNSSLDGGSPNIQSYSMYTSSGTTGTITNLIGGSLPTTATTGTPARIPCFFFSAVGGNVAAALTAGTKYYIKWLNSGATFEVYAAITGGSAIDITTGAVGSQYFNTFYPVSGDGLTTITFTPQRLNLPFFETAQCMAEVGNTIIIGGATNTLYPWDQISPLPASLIPLPENNTVKMITVNNMAYVLAGNKGNIYVTNGSTASLVTSVPDYCAGIAGSPSTYVEPYFVWGDVMYLRGRVYFSVLDQTSTKAGNCGGVWSFVPIQNFFIGQDAGLAIRLENTNSYGTFNGVCTALIPAQNQQAISPQYWSAWMNSYSEATSTFGIDNTSTTNGNGYIETDLIPTGTVLSKESFKQIEYKLSSPLASGEEILISYRINATDAFTTIDDTTRVIESVTALSGYYPVTFEKTQWLQLRITLNPLGIAGASFVRLKEIRIR